MLKPRWSRASGCRGVCVIPMQLALLALMASQVPAANLTLQISNEIAPAGGWAQIKVFAAAPVLISSGRILMDFDPSIFGPIMSVAVFSAAGDAEGIALVNGQSLNVTFRAPSASVGQLPDLPILTVTIPLLANAPSGAMSGITLQAYFPDLIDTSADQNGEAYTVSVTPGSVTFGGSLSVQNVMPGGGLLPAGTLIRINGTGFSAGTTLAIAGVSLSSIQFVSPNEMDATLGGAADLTGKQLVVGNPDGSQVRFFSAVKSAPDETPANEATLEPLLSMQTWRSAATTFTSRGGTLALQNPNQSAVDVILQSQSPGTGIQTAVTIPPGSLEVYDEQSNSSVSALATLPVRMLGMEFIPGAIITAPVFPMLPPLHRVTATPASLAFNWQVGTAIPDPGRVYLQPESIDPNITLTAAVSGIPFSIPSVPALPGPLFVAVNPVGLPPGSYSGTVTITPQGPNAVVTTISLSLTISSQALLYASPGSITLAAPGDHETILITSNGNLVPFSATASSSVGSSLLSVSSSNGTTPAIISVTANATLADGIYNGQVTVTGPNNTLIVPVQVSVDTSKVFTFSPPSVTFSIQAGSPAPPAQIVGVAGPNTGLSFSVSTLTGGPWLSVSYGKQLAVMVNPAGLAVGAYHGTVTLTSASSPVQASLPVTLVIWNRQPTLSVSPSSIEFVMAENSVVPESSTKPPTQTLQVTSGGVPVNFTLNASPSNYGLSVTSVTPASVPIPAEIGPNPGAYEYDVTITSGSQTITVPVTTYITTSPAAPPFLGSMVNAASQIPSAVAPGEILTVYGFGAGPSKTTGFTLDASGNVATTLNGAQVLFDGKPAPMIYGSAYMANLIVPYEVANQAATTIQLQYGDVTSTAWSVPVAPTAPGIFALSGAGVGQAAVLNQDNSVNGASNPALRGSVVQIFATGEGQTSPPGVTGSVIGSNLKKPLQPVIVIIGGQDATVQYFGSAGDAVAGLLQVNAVVPQNVSPGNTIPITISAGGLSSQARVTIAVK